MPRRRSTSWSAAALLLVALVGPVTQPGAAQDGEDEAHVVERIRELRGEIEALLDGLSPEARRRVEERLRGDASDAAAVAAPEEEPDLREAAAASPAAVADASAASSKETPGPAQTRCLPLRPFDTSEDLALTGADRYWRHFYLWFGAEDAVPDAERVVSLFDLGIRGLALDLRTYRDSEGLVGDIRWGSSGVLRLFGKGAEHGDQGILVVDNDGLLAGERLRLVDAEGQPLPGMQILRPESVLLDAGGERSTLDCPEPATSAE